MWGALRAADDNDPIVPGTSRKVSEWVKVLESEQNPKVRQRVLVALEIVGPRPRLVLPALCQAVAKDPDADVRLGAVLTMDRMRVAAEEAKIDPQALIECLATATAGEKADKDERVRAAAATALGRMGFPARIAVPALALALKDKQTIVQKAASEGIDRLGEDADKAAPAMADLLKERGANVLARCSAASFLARVADNDVAVPALSAVLKGEPTAPARLKRTVLEMLGTCGKAAADAVPLMAESLQDKDVEVRIAAGAALTQVGGAARIALPALRRSLKDPDKYVRAQVVEVLGKLGHDAAEAVPDLIECLKTEKIVDVRVAVMKALGEFGPDAKDAVELLTAAARSTQPGIREAAESALKKIRGS
jgi:HEAT repeat protein